MNEKEFYYLLGYVKVSSVRTLTLKSLEHGLKMPSEIKKENKLPLTQVSNALSCLKRKKLVECINEDMRKGRLYQCTDLGRELLKEL